MRKPVICFKDFTFKYDSQVDPTLYDINLTIYEGEKVLIVGPSGSGKSTLGHCINGLVPFSYQGEITGSLTINGKETKDLDIFSIGKMVGTVLQDPDGQFIGLTVGEDIAFSLENDLVPQGEMLEKVRKAAKLVDMEAYLDSSLHQLSGGQKQRVGLAGVLVDNVDILLFDEPLANLDPQTGVHAISLIDEIQSNSNATVIIIEHRLEDVLDVSVDRIIVVDNGRIISDSTPDLLLSSTILETCFIREPLYVKAAKYAGVNIQPEMYPAHIDTFEIGAETNKLVNWEAGQGVVEQVLKNEPLLELRDVTFGYKSGKQTVKGVSFTLNKGEMMSIVGKNGAGKSTLSKLICGLEKVESGSIIFHNEDITKDTIKKRAERVGIVMQNPNHMISKHMIFDEVAYGLVLRGVSETEIKERVEAVLKVCGLYAFRNWPIAALSFGQKKRVTIASILVLDPEVIILDEPTAGQDFKHYTEMMEFLSGLNKQGIAIIMITHDMHLMLEYTPRAIVVYDGQIIADGNSVDILSNKEVVEKANLKTTSLFTLAEKAGIENPHVFIEKFIAYDREVGRTWQ